MPKNMIIGQKFYGQRILNLLSPNFDIFYCLETRNQCLGKRLSIFKFVSYFLKYYQK